MNLLPVDELPQIPTESPLHAYLIRNIGLRDGTHKFHRFPGKFIPHIPRWAIKRYVRGDRPNIILDPFCGSGTTLVEAALSGHVGYGFDIDPVARLVSKVKSTPLELGAFRTCGKVLRDFINDEREGKFKPVIPTLSHWFNEQTVRDLSLIREGVELFKRNQDIYDFLLVVLLAIIRRTSNADNQTQKTYVSHTHPKTPEPAKPLFLKTLDEYIDRVLEFSRLHKLMGGHATVLGAWDARTFSTAWTNRTSQKADLAITSPPYVKSVDYVYNQMAEYFWIGDLFGLSTQREQNNHKELYIGTQQVKATEHSSLRTGLTAVDNLLDRISQTSRKNAHITYKYFVDMGLHFAEMSKVLQPGAHYVLVVGDSIVSQENVATHLLLPDFALRHGFTLERSFAYEIRNRHMRFPRGGRGGIVKYDWILDFRFTI